MTHETRQKGIFSIPPLLILILFFLPWVAVSCGGTTERVSGYQIAIEDSPIPVDIRLSVIAIGVAGIVAFGAVLVKRDIHRKVYTGAGLVAGVIYLYLLARFGALSQDATSQGGTLTIEPATWGIGMAIIAIVGLGMAYRFKEPVVVTDEWGNIQQPVNNAQETEQARMIRYAVLGGLALFLGVLALSLVQSIGKDMERQRIASDGTATRQAAIQSEQNRQATSIAQSNANLTATAYAHATGTVVAVDNISTAQAIDTQLATDPLSVLTEQAMITFLPESAYPSTIFFRYPAGWEVTQKYSNYENILEVANQDVALEIRYLKYFTHYISESDLELYTSFYNWTSYESSEGADYRFIQRYGHPIQIASKVVRLVSDRREYNAAAFMFTPENGGMLFIIRATGRFDPYIGLFDAILSTVGVDEMGEIAFFQAESPYQLMSPWVASDDSWMQHSQYNTELPGDLEYNSIWLSGNSDVENHTQLCYPVSGNIDTRLGFSGDEYDDSFFYLQSENQRIGFQIGTRIGRLKFYRIVDGVLFQSEWLDNFDAGYPGYNVKIVYTDGRVALYYWDGGDVDDWVILMDDVEVNLPESFQICIGGSPSVNSLHIFGEAMQTEPINPYKPIPIIDPTQPFILKASDYWLDTYLDVRAGQILTITATGNIKLCYTNDCPTSNADGLRSWGSEWYYGDYDMIQTLSRSADEQFNSKPGQLLARIGDGGPIPIGANRTIGISESGRLYLTINDSPYLLHDNSGELTITLSEGGVSTRTPSASSNVVPTSNPTPGTPIQIEHELECRETVASLNLENGVSVIVTCADDCTNAPTDVRGVIYGTDIYTHNSSICRAALHSGILSTQPFRVDVLTGRSSYESSTRNGIFSYEYGSSHLSFSLAPIP